MKPLKIRDKFALWNAALVGAVLLVFATGTFFNLYHEQIEAVDLELEATSRHVAASRDPASPQKTLEELVEFQPWFAVAEFDANGSLNRRSPDLPESMARAALNDTTLRTMRDAAGEGWRVTTVRHGASTYVLAYSLVETNEIIEHLLMAFGLSLPFVLMVAAFGGRWVAGRALAPLGTFTTAAESIRADQLHRRVPVPAAADEIHRLAGVLNAMLARLEKSFEQARRFAADASHELRTPLTIIGGEVEQLLRIPALPSAAEDKLLSLQEEIGRLQRIAEQMLLLARFDAGGTADPLTDVNLSEVIRLACDDAELLASAKGVSIEAAIAPGIGLKVDESHLRRLALNLLDNAIRYNHPGGTVRCMLETRGGAARLTVGNSGAGIPPAARSQLFQRFFRIDGARTRGGHGLGLSLCREIARAHHGDVELGAASTDSWTEFVVSLPATAQAASNAGNSVSTMT